MDALQNKVFMMQMIQPTMNFLCLIRYFSLLQLQGQFMASMMQINQEALVQAIVTMHGIGNQITHGLAEIKAMVNILNTIIAMALQRLIIGQTEAPQMFSYFFTPNPQQ